MASPYVSDKIRWRVENRADSYCEYCRRHVNYFFPPTTDHIDPDLRSSDPGNLAFSCMPCNWSKREHTTGMDPLTGEMTRLYHPRKDKWSDHFRWSDDWLLILGITPVGRATVELLNLNISAWINIRRVTIGEVHPPEDFIQT